MDSVSHTTVARYLLDYVESADQVSFDRKAFCFGNLKPDLRGEYLTKRHYPSLMFEEVMQRIRDFAARFRIHADNGTRLSEELGVICHYLTDFFSFPHNDDIYRKSLLAHYIYEKRTSFTIARRIDADRFDRWAQSSALPRSTEELIAALTAEHQRYTAQQSHSIQDDIIHICGILTLAVRSLIRLTSPV